MAEPKRPVESPGIPRDPHDEAERIRPATEQIERTADPQTIRRAVLDLTETVVVKVGTNVLSRDDDQLDRNRIASLAEQLATIRSGGRRVILVSSGAVGAGLGVMGLSQRPTELPRLQAAAALGQARLIRYYDDALAPFGLHAAQLLLTGNGFKQRQRYLNTRNTLAALADSQSFVDSRR